ncbi:MAG TPA: hypothetical protein VGA52_11090 [Anaerolineales bacterium]|jgi:hypothetical protein
MFYTEAIYIGVNPSSGGRPLQYAALDIELRLVARGEGDMEEVLAFIGGQDAAIVAVDSPQRPSLGLLAQPEVRSQFDLPTDGKTYRNWRLAEYELRRRNIRLVNTATLERIAKDWLENGYRLYGRLEQMGYQAFRVGGRPARQLMLEVQPHAGYSVLLKRQPFPKDSLEGRLQRQLVLFLEGVDLPNPMRSLEEITRHHLLRGELPLRDVFPEEHLDALLAAYTALLVGTATERVVQVGDREEGFITLPTADLKSFYP